MKNFFGNRYAPFILIFCLLLVILLLNLITDRINNKRLYTKGDIELIFDTEEDNDIEQVALTDIDTEETFEDVEDTEVYDYEESNDDYVSSTVNDATEPVSDVVAVESGSEYDNIHMSEYFNVTTYKRVLKAIFSYSEAANNYISSDSVLEFLGQTSVSFLNIESVDFSSCSFKLKVIGDGDVVEPYIAEFNYTLDDSGKISNITSK